MSLHSLADVFADYELLDADDRYRLLIDLGRELGRFDLRNQLSSNRTQGIPNMIALVRDTAQRLAA